MINDILIEDSVNAAGTAFNKVRDVAMPHLRQYSKWRDTKNRRWMVLSVSQSLTDFEYKTITLVDLDAESITEVEFEKWNTAYENKHIAVINQL